MLGGGRLCPGGARKASQKRCQLCWALKMCRNWTGAHGAEEKGAAQAKAGKYESVLQAKARAQDRERRKPKASLYFVDRGPGRVNPDKLRFTVTRGQSGDKF